MSKDKPKPPMKPLPKRGTQRNPPVRRDEKGRDVVPADPKKDDRMGNSGP